MKINGLVWSDPMMYSFPGGSTKDYKYDPLMRVKRITSKDPGGNVLVDYDYAYDRMDNITTRETEHGDYTYDYDELYRLIEADNPTVSDEAFTYDPVGNRLTSAGTSGEWAYNPNNELEGYDGTTFAYDENGNTIRKTQDTVVTHYLYNEEDRLARVEDESNNVIAEYHYDPFGRRLWKEVDGERSYFVYSDEGLVGECDDTGSLTRSYGYVPGSTWTTDPLFMKEAGDYYLYHNDHLGTPQKMTAAKGAVVWSAYYSSFGKTVVSPESTVVNNFRFPGQYYDEETRLRYNWHRYYDSWIGRFVKTDPIGFLSGPNGFVYTWNNAVNMVDISGLYTLQEAALLQYNSIDPKPSVNSVEWLEKFIIWEHKLTNKERFEIWLNWEKARGEWWSDLPDCPCTTKCIDESEWGDLTDNLHGYHIGADKCMRSKPKNGRSNQCCYDSNGRLITHGSGSGSSDNVPGSFPTFFGHKANDMDPADLAKKLDNGKWGKYSEKYLLVRPQIGSEKCPKNP